MTTHILQEGQAPSLTHSGYSDAPCPADAPLEGDRFSFVIGQESAGERIDKVLADYMPGQSRSYLKKLIKDGYVRILNDPSGSSRQVVRGGALCACLTEAIAPHILHRIQNHRRAHACHRA